MTYTYSFPYLDKISQSIDTHLKSNHKIFKNVICKSKILYIITLEYISNNEKNIFHNKYFINEIPLITAVIQEIQNDLKSLEEDLITRKLQLQDAKDMLTTRENELTIRTPSGKPSPTDYRIAFLFQHNPSNFSNDFENHNGNIATEWQEIKLLQQDISDLYGVVQQTIEAITLHYPCLARMLKTLTEKVNTFTPEEISVIQKPLFEHVANIQVFLSNVLARKSGNPSHNAYSKYRDISIQFKEHKTSAQNEISEHIKILDFNNENILCHINCLIDLDHIIQNDTTQKTAWKESELTSHTSSIVTSLTRFKKVTENIESLYYDECLQDQEYRTKNINSLKALKTFSKYRLCHDISSLISLLQILQTLKETQENQSVIEKLHEYSSSINHIIKLAHDLSLFLQAIEGFQNKECPSKIHHAESCIKELFEKNKTIPDIISEYNDIIQEVKGILSEHMPNKTPTTQMEIIEITSYEQVIGEIPL